MVLAQVYSQLKVALTYYEQMFFLYPCIPYNHLVLVCVTVSISVDVPTLPSSDDEDSNEPSDAAIGGIIVGVLLFITVAVVIILMVVYTIISKRKLTKVAVTSVV